MIAGRIEPSDDERERAAPVHQAPGQRRQEQDRQPEHREREPDQAEAGPEPLQEEAPDHLVGAGREVAADVDDERRDQAAIEQAHRDAAGLGGVALERHRRQPPGARSRASPAGTPCRPAGARRASALRSRASAGRSEWPPGSPPGHRRRRRTRSRRIDPLPNAPIAGPSSRPPIWAAPYRPKASPRRSGGVASVR